MKHLRAVVFDLDDTLYPEREYVLSGFRAVSHWVEQNLRIPADTVYPALEALFAAGVRGNTFDKWVTAEALPAELVPTLIRVYRGHRPVLRPFFGIEALLEKLKRHYYLGLVSDGYLDVQRAKWNALGVADHFHSVVFSDLWGRQAWKPSTRPFIEVIGQLGVAAAEAVYVADNRSKDFYGARQVGMSTIWCRYSKGDHCCLASPSTADTPNASVDTLAELEVRLLPADG